LSQQKFIFTGGGSSIKLEKQKEEPMKRILYFLLMSSLSAYATTNIIEQIHHRPTIENLRIKTIEDKLGISRTDWKYNIEEDKQLEVIWHEEGAKDVYKWIVEKESNPSQVLSLVITLPSDLNSAIWSPDISFGSDLGALETKFTVMRTEGEGMWSLQPEELSKLKLDGAPVTLWTLLINNGSGLEPYWRATVQLKKKPNQQVEPIVTTPGDRTEAQSTQAHP
jgi:hypothetical protein